MKSSIATSLTLALLVSTSNGFTAPGATQSRASTATSMTNARDSEGSAQQQQQRQSRRSVLSSLLTATAAAGASVLFPNGAFAEAESMERGGVPLTPFNSLAFNYRGGESPTVDASAIDEVSIPYAEFLEKLASDQVEFVEFLAPNGDKAYATFKAPAVAVVAAAAEGEEGVAASSSAPASSSSSKPIRIGEGYPTEDPEGWSSPAFVIKAVAKKNVPYKFVVPGLSDSFKNNM